MSNDILKSVEHQVLANRVGPRLSVACFFTLYPSATNRVYGPIKELVSEHKPAVYLIDTSVQEFVTHYQRWQKMARHDKFVLRPTLSCMSSYWAGIARYEIFRAVLRPKQMGTAWHVIT